MKASEVLLVLIASVLLATILLAAYPLDNRTTTIRLAPKPEKGYNIDSLVLITTDDLQITDTIQSRIIEYSSPKKSRDILYGERVQGTKIRVQLRKPMVNGQAGGSGYECRFRQYHNSTCIGDLCSIQAGTRSWCLEPNQDSRCPRCLN